MTLPQLVEDLGKLVLVFLLYLCTLPSHFLILSIVMVHIIFFFLAAIILGLIVWLFVFVFFSFILTVNDYVISVYGLCLPTINY
jgi:hypothetical protein